MKTSRKVETQQRSNSDKENSELLNSGNSENSENICEKEYLWKVIMKDRQEQ